MLVSDGSIKKLCPRQRKSRRIILLSFTLLISLRATQARPQLTKSSDAKFLPNLSSILGIDLHPESEFESKDHVLDKSPDQSTRAPLNATQNLAEIEEPSRNTPIKASDQDSSPSRTLNPKPSQPLPVWPPKLDAPQAQSPSVQTPPAQSTSADEDSGGAGLSPGAIAAIVIGSFIGLLLVLAILGMVLRKVEHSVEEEKQLQRLKKERLSVKNRLTTEIETREAQT